MPANTANPADNLHGHCFTPDRRWSARMELDFAVRQGRTTLTKMQFSGPGAGIPALPLLPAAPAGRPCERR